MMKREWKAILNRYGRTVRLENPGRPDVEKKVFLQPVLDQDRQIQPSLLGLRREERMLCLGPGDMELRPGETVVTDRAVRYEVRSTRSVGDGHHVWAILQRLEEET